MATSQLRVEPIKVRNKADFLWLAVERQHQRILAGRPEGCLPSPVEIAQLANDFDAYVNAANRLLRLAELALSQGLGGHDLRKAVETFTIAAPVRPVRDTAEHFDAYSLGKGYRQRHGEPVSEFLFTAYADEVLVTYAEFRVPIRRTTRGAAELHRAIRMAVDDLSRDDPEWRAPLVDLAR